jgi:uncharacterized SAM-binding protein YcdF (DUF218 family)
MFYSNLCDRPLPEKPIFVDWFTFVWFNKPVLIAILILSVFGIYWVIRHARWKHRFNGKRGFVWLLGFTAALVLMPFVADKALVVSLPSDPGSTVDAIVLLGRGPFPFSEPRVNLAAEFWQAKRSPVIFASGRIDAINMIERLKAKGIPDRVLDGEDCSLTTWENAVFTAAVLQPQGIRRILLITDEPHMWRSLLVFRANGFDVIPRATPIFPGFLGKKAQFFLTLREYAGLVSYGLRGLYFPKRSPELNSPDLLHLVQKAERYGQQRRLQK